MSIATTAPKPVLCGCGREYATFSEGPGLPAIGKACIAKVGERVRLAETLHTNDHVSSGRLFQDCHFCWPHGASA